MQNRQRTTIAQRIRSKRVAAGLTQAAVAQKIGVTQATVSNWENGNTEPSDDELRRLADIIGRVNRPRNLLPPEAATDDADDDEPDDDAAAFGVWLGQTRLAKGWSVPELAKRARVSMPTVYAIEAGRIANPRDQTRTKLQSALGESPDAEVAAEAERQAAVEGIGELVDFNPHDPDDIPTEPGVYVLYDISQRPIYVGQGGSIRSRLKDHEQKFWFKRPIVETGAYVVVRDNGSRQQIESLLFRFLKSNAVLNKQNVDRRDG